MPRVDFTPENKVATTNYDYPKLKLKKGEMARIMAGLESPVTEFVHTLRKPQIINGVPQMYKAERKDKTTYDAHKMDFISRPICLGDATTLSEKGSDPKNCPMCRMAQTNPDYTKPPQRRYAMHVIRYRTKAGTTDVATPFSVELVVWSFTDKIFNKMVDIRSEWGDLRKHDLLLGPCTVEDFQQFDIAPANKAAWLEDAARKELTVQTFRDNQIPDLTIACGSVKQREWVEQDVATIVEEWAKVHGHEAATANADSTGLDTDLNDLLAGTSVSENKKAPKPEPKPIALAKPVSYPPTSSPIRDEDVDIDGVLLNEQPGSPSLSDDLLGDLDFSVAEAASPAPESSGVSPESFEDLLADL